MRYVVVEIVGWKSPTLWAVQDTKDKQIVNTGRSRLDMQEWADAMSLWELNRETPNPAKERP